MKRFPGKNRNRDKTSKKGFTLIELLISIMLFTVFLGIVSQSYLSIVRSQKQANEVRKMYSELRVFMDSFAEDVRLGAIEYNCYDPAQAVDFSGNPLCMAESVGTISSGFTDVLSLIKKGGGEKTTYKIQKDQITDEMRIKVKKWYRASTGGWTEIPGYEEFRDVFSDRIVIQSAAFAIFPAVNPYSSLYYRDNAVQFQPKVTLFLDAGGGDIEFDYQFQTTISSRVYTREI